MGSRVVWGSNGHEWNRSRGVGPDRPLRYNKGAVGVDEEFDWEPQGAMLDIYEGLVLESFVPAVSIAVEGLVGFVRHNEIPRVFELLQGPLPL